MEEKVIQVFEKVGCNIDSSNIEECHCITKRNDRVIVKFSRQKDCQQVLSVKKNLQKLKMEDIGLTGDNKVFINHSLCPYYRVLWSKSKVLLNMGKINRLMVSNGTAKVKISKISAPISITHADDFTKYFPDVDLYQYTVWLKPSTCLLVLFYIIIEFFSFSFCYCVLGLLTFFMLLFQLSLSFFFSDKLFFEKSN